MKNKKRTSILVLLAVTLLATVGVVLLYRSKVMDKPTDSTRPVNTVDYGKPTSAQQNPATDKPSVKIEQENKDDQLSSDQLSVTITAINQNGSLLQTRALIHPLISSGQCTLRLTKAGQESIVKTSSVQPLPNSSTCMGFDVDTSVMAKGEWTLQLQVSSGQLGGSVSKEVDVL